MYHNEGLSFCIEFALSDGLWSAGHHVAHIIIGDLGGAQRELGHDVSVIRHPFGGCWHRRIGDCVVCCLGNKHRERTRTFELMCCHVGLGGK